MTAPHPLTTPPPPKPANRRGVWIRLIAWTTLLLLVLATVALKQLAQRDRDRLAADARAQTLRETRKKEALRDQWRATTQHWVGNLTPEEAERRISQQTTILQPIHRRDGLLILRSADDLSFTILSNGQHLRALIVSTSNHTFFTPPSPLWNAVDTFLEAGDFGPLVFLALLLAYPFARPHRPALAEAALACVLLTATFSQLRHGRLFDLGNWPFTFILLLALLTTLLLLAHAHDLFPRRSRHPDPYPRCPTCHYNLTANLSGTCPECGTPAPENFT